MNSRRGLGIIQIQYSRSIWESQEYTTRGSPLFGEENMVDFYSCIMPRAHVEEFVGSTKRIFNRVASPDSLEVYEQRIGRSKLPWPPTWKKVRQLE